MDAVDAKLALLPRIRKRPQWLFRSSVIPAETIRAAPLSATAATRPTTAPARDASITESVGLFYKP